MLRNFVQYLRFVGAESERVVTYYTEKEIEITQSRKQ